MDELEEAIQGTLEHRTGADQEPVEILEVNARGNVLRVGGLVLDLGQFQVMLEGKEIHLTPMEFDLLSLFMQRPGLEIKTKELIKTIHGLEVETRSARKSIRDLICKLRRKIEADPKNPCYIHSRYRGYAIALN